MVFKAISDGIWSNSRCSLGQFQMYFGAIPDLKSFSKQYRKFFNQSFVHSISYNDISVRISLVVLSVLKCRLLSKRKKIFEHYRMSKSKTLPVIIKGLIK